MSHNKKIIDYSFVVALFLFGLYYYCFRILGFDLSRTPGDYGDSRFINYILEHGYKWLLGKDPDFWQANFMYPLKNNVAISDSMLGALPLYALFRAIGNDVETAYQLWWLSTCVLNFWCCVWAFKKIGFNYFLAAIGAYVFAFGINNFNQFVHLQFNFKFLIPVAVAATYLFLQKANTKYFIVLVLSIVLQFFASAYLGLLLIYFLIVFVLLFLAFKSNRELFFNQLNKKIIFQCSLAFVSGIALMLVVAVPYQSMAKEIGYRNYDIEMLPHLPRVYSYFFPNSSSVTWEFLKNSPLKNFDAWYLQDMFAGIVCYAGVFSSIVYFVRCKIKKAKVNFLPLILFSVCVLFVLLFSKTENNFSLFKYFRILPGLSSMRLTQRFMIIEVFFLLWLTLFFLQHIFKREKISAYFIIALIVIADNLFLAQPEVLSITPKQIRQERVEKMCRKITRENTANKKIIACVNTADDSEVFMQLDVMLATQKLNLYTLNGYSSTCYGELCNSYNDTAHVKLSAWLQRFGLRDEDVLFINNN